MSDLNDAILVVDDDVPFCTALRSALRRRGIKCLIAHTFEDAIEEAEAWTPGRAVVDLRLAERSGLELVGQLSSAHPNMTIVVLTGYGSITTAVTAIKLGAANYLTKPAEVDDILKAFDTEAKPAVALAESNEPLSMRELEHQHMLHVYAETGGNVSKTARILGIDRRTVQRHLARLRETKEEAPE
tara:strand:- start:3609 stop:4166 length:558 start_codon:yes stop_codon:yes gene_type:complete